MLFWKKSKKKGDTASSSPSDSSSSTTAPPPPASAGEGSIKLHVATGYAGLMPRKWGDTTTWSVSVNEDDTIDTLSRYIKQVSGETPNMKDLLVASSPSVRLVSDHTELKNPHPSATIAENGLKTGMALRWWNGMMD